MDRKITFTVVLAAYPAWLAFLVLHELGHVLNAWLTGGLVRFVDVPLWGFSHTDVSPNPHPALVACGGAIWGTALPVLLMVVARRVSRGVVARAAIGSAGLCLVANGAYLAFGGFLTAGDAADLVRFGVPVWTLALVGFAQSAAGLGFWHFATQRAREERGKKAARS
ncbi:MAG: hypothetical protein U1D55_06840 [Phycisphaerae bacterium]